jgi:transposase
MKGGYWTARQRQILEQALTDTRDAALLRRVLALSLIDQGRSVTEVAQWLHVGRSSLHRWIREFATHHNLAALEDHRGPGRPAQWNEDLDSLVESALARRPAELGYPANTWTVPLLQAFLAACSPRQEVSSSTLHRHLKALGYVWKRFRYVLAPDPEAEKKTPDFAANTGLARNHRAPGGGRNVSPAPAVRAGGLDPARTGRRRPHLRS